MATDGGLTAPARGFQIMSPTVDVDPMSEITFCYYFRTSNTTDLAIKQWASHMTDGVEQMVLFLTPSDQQPPSTLTTAQCGIHSTTIGPDGPVWTYSAEAADAQTTLPADDGTGQPVGQMVKANQSGYLEMHFANPTGQTMHAYVDLVGYAYDDGVQTTTAAPFITYNTQIDLPAAPSPSMPTSQTVTGNCKVDAGAKFYLVSAHTFKQATRAFVKDGDTMVFDTTDGANPGSRQWDSTPFYSFMTNTLMYQCEYQNPNDRQIETGDSAATDEVCIAFGYYFPADDSIGHFCLNSAMVY